MMQSPTGAADDWSLASESRYDRGRAIDLGNFAPRLTAGVMKMWLRNLLFFSSVILQVLFSPSHFLAYIL